MLQNLVTYASGRVARHFYSKPFRMQNRAPLVSFTFDNCPESAYANGASILENHDIYGTFYIASGICNTDATYWQVITREQIRALHEHGHEIGCHTSSHVNVETLSASRMDEECRTNHNTLRRLCGDIHLTNFSYPSGFLSLPRKLQLQKRFDSCRGNYEGINVGTIDLGLLKVIDLYNRTLTPEKLQRVLHETCDRNGWLIFHAHDVEEPPTFMGCSPAILRATIETVQSMGISCVSIREGLRHIGYSSI